MNYLKRYVLRAPRTFQWVVCINRPRHHPTLAGPRAACFPKHHRTAVSGEGTSVARGACLRPLALPWLGGGASGGSDCLWTRDHLAGLAGNEAATP